MSRDLARIVSAVVKGDVEAIADLTKSALDQGLSASDVLSQGLMPAMDQVGAQFKNGEVFVPEILMSGHAMQASLDVLKPFLASGELRANGRMVIGTVKGDLHEIGKNLVAMMVEGAGFQVHNLGRDVAPAAFVEAVRREKPDVLAMSSLLTTTMLAMKATIDALAQAGLRDQVKVIVGGAPVSKDFAAQIGADGYAPDAQSAVMMIRAMAVPGRVQ
jgi:5-methyltetrahydrofolate--homocysteine methyltransferase